MTPKTNEQKIAEHIAKFNAPEGVFYWVDDLNYENCTREMETCNLKYLALKIEDDNFRMVHGGRENWLFAIKHEPK